MKRKQRRITLLGLVLAMAVSIMPSVVYGSETGKNGVPYTPEGIYDVTIPHVIVNQVYGGKNDGSASHSFIELYNQTEQDVDLSGWKLAYRSSADGDQADAWAYLELTGTIPAKDYYLIRCGNAAGTYAVPEGDQEWDIPLHNKGVSVALLSDDTVLTEEFSGAVTDENRPDGYVDVLAVQGNDEKDTQMPPVYENGVAAIQSKKKAVRRIGFSDTDDNALDAESIDYSKEVEKDLGPHGKSDESGTDEEEVPPADTYRNVSFSDEAALVLEKTGGITIGEANADGGVAEIVAYNADNRKAYVVNGQAGVLNVIPVNADGSLGNASEIPVKDLIDGFSYGDMTSVDIDTVYDRVVIALQDADYAANGRVAVLDYDGNLIADYETGVQPDMVKVSKSGKWILTANEGEPRNGYGDGCVDPEGSITLINTQTGEGKTVGFEKFDSQTLSDQGILFNKVNGQILSAAEDLEPEYIALNGDETKAYVSLQEANAIAIFDIDMAEFTGIYSLGFQDYSQVEVDLVEDGVYAPATYANVAGVRMPDGISAFEINGTTYLATANEGDAREWGEFLNEAKVTLTDTEENTVKKVRVLDKNVTAGLDDETEYLFGGRSFSIYNADTMELVYDSGSLFESVTAQYLPNWFNCSNDDISVDSRSPKKGPEPESVTVNRIGNGYYAFVALERIGGIMVFDVTDPASSSYVNYINTRDFPGEIVNDVSPEGLAFISSNHTESGKPMLLAACEVSGTVAAYTIDGSATDVPTPEEPADTGKLQEAVDAASELNEDDYTEDSWNEFQEALSNAKAVLANKNAAQDEVDDALSALTEARGKLVKKEPTQPDPVDKSVLKAAIARADSLKEEDYTAESWKVLADAKAEAERVMKDENATQDDVNAAVQALTKVENSLVEAPEEPEEPEEPVKPPVISNIIKKITQAVKDYYGKIIEAIKKWF